VFAAAEAKRRKALTKEQRDAKDAAMKQYMVTRVVSVH
jgi:hypothetical protein